MRPLVFALPGNDALADALAQHWPGDRGALDVHRFPDDETLARLGEPVRGRDVMLACTLRSPDEKLWPLLAAADTARELGARSVGLVAPYLAYMRQDQAFAEGQAVTARLFARLLSAHFDWLATVDPHLHRIHALDEIYSIPCAAVAAAPLLADWIDDTVERPLLIGPDDESRQWVGRIAELAQAPVLILEKRRLGDRQVELALPDVAAFRDRTPVLVDDIVSSGGTLAEAIRGLRAQALAAPWCVVVHAVFAPGAYEGLLEAGAARVVTSNTIAHASNAIDVAAMLAQEGNALVARLPFLGTKSRYKIG